MRSARRPVQALAVGILLAALGAPLPATAHVAARPQTVGDYQHQARVATGNARERHDLHPLKKRDCVQRYARRQARRMARQERMFHQDLGVVMAACHLSGVAENVAVGYPTGRAVVKAWLGSEGHRANLLEPSYRQLGLAMRYGANGQPYAAQVFGRR